MRSYRLFPAPRDAARFSRVQRWPSPPGRGPPTGSSRRCAPSPGPRWVSASAVDDDELGVRLAGGAQHDVGDLLAVEQLSPVWALRAGIVMRRESVVRAHPAAVARAPRDSGVPWKLVAMGIVQGPFQDRSGESRAGPGQCVGRCRCRHSGFVRRLARPDTCRRPVVRSVCHTSSMGDAGARQGRMLGSCWPHPRTCPVVRDARLA